MASEHTIWAYPKAVGFSKNLAMPVHQFYLTFQYIHKAVCNIHGWSLFTSGFTPHYIKNVKTQQHDDTNTFLISTFWAQQIWSAYDSSQQNRMFPKHLSSDLFKFTS